MPPWGIHREPVSGKILSPPTVDPAEGLELRWGLDHTLLDCSIVCLASYPQGRLFEVDLRGGELALSPFPTGLHE